MIMLKETKNLLKKYRKQHTVEAYWTYLACGFFLLLAGALLYSSWLFTTTTTALDEPALPAFESNSSKLRAIDTSLTLSEEAIYKRTGETVGTVSIVE